jgi:hypothetical protein
VGLAEIIYPHTRYSVNNGDEKYWVAVIGVGRNRIQTVNFPSVYHESGSDIAAVLNGEFSCIVQNCIAECSYSKIIDRFSLSVQTQESQVFGMSEDLQRYMVFNLSTVSLDPIAFGTMTEQTLDVNRGLNLMSVYCDVATHTIVVDMKTPLLRARDVTGKHGEFVRHTYVQPHYVPVGRREFESIEIALNNEISKPMPLKYEKSAVTLHFRRKTHFSVKLWAITFTSRFLRTLPLIRLLPGQHGLPFRRQNTRTRLPGR